MFEKIVIRRHSSDAKPIDAGLLAETLLFYEHVHILLDRSGLSSLLLSIGPDSLIALLKQKRISATFLADNLGTVTTTVQGFQHHNFAEFQIARDKDGTKITPKDWVRRGFEETLGNQYGLGRKAKRFIENISFRKHADERIADMARDDLNDQAYLRSATKFILGSVLIKGFRS